MSFTYPYPRPALTVDALVLGSHENVLYILLIQRGIEPFRNFWALPGGFVNMDETLESACIRELKEETGILLNRMDQFRVFDATGRDPRGRTISVVFHAYLPELRDARGGDDAAVARWFPVDRLPKLAFDHNDIVDLFFSEKNRLTE